MTEPYFEKIHVGDELAEVERVQEVLCALWESRELPPELEHTVSLALEEVLSNVLRHGHAGCRSREITVTFRVDAAGFEFEVADGAAPFDPLARPDPDVTLPLERRKPGGLGVFLVKRLADELAYEFKDGRNHLRFRKQFG
jgi:anti-sigma regulatory factor (Ser/Thr protein kinase)